MCGQSVMLHLALISRDFVVWYRTAVSNMGFQSRRARVTIEPSEDNTLARELGTRSFVRRLIFEH